jgi:hypothetical protein
MTEWWTSMVNSLISCCVFLLQLDGSRQDYMQFMGLLCWVFLVVVPCSLVGECLYFGGTCRLYLRSSSVWGQELAQLYEQVTRKGVIQTHGRKWNATLASPLPMGLIDRLLFNVKLCNWASSLSYTLYLWRWRQCVLPKRRYPPTTTHNTDHSVITVMETSRIK